MRRAVVLHQNSRYTRIRKSIFGVQASRADSSMKATVPKQADTRADLRAAEVLDSDQISAAVEDALAGTQFIDIHTHLFAPSLGKLGLWGIDELLTYHYLEAEFFRSSSSKPERYFSLSK